MTKTIFLAFFAATLATVFATVAYRGLAVLRATRRAAWELDRAEWRHWMSRP